MNKNSIKKYKKQIKALLPFYSKKERRFMRELNDSFNHYIEKNPKSTMLEIQEQFGTPQEIVREYIDSFDVDILIRKLSIRKIIKRVFIALLLALVIGLGIFSAFTYKAYLEYKNTLVIEAETDVTNK
ncbi:DUF6120 family protein [Hornefia butyriciproducens]|uniref:DUF6120 family protein n=1 Tax=Hornefia butyriciproducens TaxID=2652293 RepID=UPI0023F14997|nr:DUF6120 family protein [Hornefia butyriciproducens]MDD6298779.1 DUF6120 family protein [Hornefia butyriciproducens]